MKRPIIDNVGLMWLCMIIAGLLALTSGVMWLTRYNTSERPTRFVKAPKGSYEAGYEDGLREGLKNISPRCWYENKINKNPDILKPEDFNNYIAVKLKSRRWPKGFMVWYPRPQEE